MSDKIILRSGREINKTQYTSEDDEDLFYEEASTILDDIVLEASVHEPYLRDQLYNKFFLEATKDDYNSVQINLNNNCKYISLTNSNMANLSIENMLKIIPDFDGTPEKLHKFLTCCNIIYAPL